VRRTEVDEGRGISRCDVTARTQAAMKLERLLAYLMGFYLDSPFLEA
jgi:hypothetical protein